MKIKDVIQRQRKAALSPLKRKVLEHIEGRSNEVFSRNDPELLEALGEKPAAVHFTLWWLEANRYISKGKADRVYFGTRMAIQELQRQLLVKERTNGRRARKK